MQHVTVETLDQKRILVVEDDYVLAREICSDLREHGATIVGPAPTVHYARLIMGKRRLDGAILDIQLFGEDVYTLADQLIGQGVPVIFATAYQAEQIREQYRNIETFHKPIDLGRLRKRVSALKPLETPLGASDIRTGLAARKAAAPPRERRPGEAESIPDRWSRALARTMREAL